VDQVALARQEAIAGLQPPLARLFTVVRVDRQHMEERAVTQNRRESAVSKQQSLFAARGWRIR
jgi:hypothetical protein